jgi:heme-degrading monooxygenase HmoA
MITIGMNYKVLPGKEEIFERSFRAVLDALEKTAGHTRSSLWKDVHEERSYLILSDWNDRAAFEAFVRSPEFAKVTTWGKENILAERPRHQIYER